METAPLINDTTIPIIIGVAVFLCVLCVLGGLVIFFLWRRSRKAEKQLVSENIQRSNSMLEMGNITKLENIEIKQKLGGGNFGGMKKKKSSARDLISFFFFFF